MSEGIKEKLAKIFKTTEPTKKRMKKKLKKKHILVLIISIVMVIGGIAGILLINTRRNTERTYWLWIEKIGKGTTDPEPYIWWPYKEGNKAILTALPNVSAGYEFAYWSGDIKSKENPLVFTVNNEVAINNRSIRLVAVFRPKTYALTINVTGQGTIYPAVGSYRYTKDTEIELIAIPDLNWVFSHWSGDINVTKKTENPITIIMDSDKNITAHFERGMLLTISVIGRGIGTTIPILGTHTYVKWTVVEITAFASQPSFFLCWFFDNNESIFEFDNPIIITMDSNKTVTAKFVYPIIPLDPPLYP